MIGLWDWSPVLPDWYDPFDAIPVEERDDEPVDPVEQDEGDGITVLELLELPFRRALSFFPRGY